MINALKDLKGENFVCSAVEDDSDKICVSLKLPFEKLETDGFNYSDLYRYFLYVGHRKPLKRKGYDLADWEHMNFDFEYNEESENFDEKWTNLMLTIYKDKFDGDITSLRENIDKYASGFKKKYETIKQRATKNKVDVKTIIPKIFKSPKVAYRHVSEAKYLTERKFIYKVKGTYSIQYKNQNLLKKDIQNAEYYITKNLLIPCPYQATVLRVNLTEIRDYVLTLLNKNQYKVTKDYIQFDNIPFTVFIQTK